MYCKHCGKEISETAKFCDGCGKPVADDVVNIAPEVEIAKKSKKKKEKKKKGHPILGTVILIFGIIMLVGAFSGGSDAPKKVEKGTPSAASSVETSAPPVFTVGDTLEMADVLVTLNNVSESHGSQFLQPTDGNVFVVCEFTIENNTDSEIAVSSLMSFEAYFDDYAANLSLGAMTTDQNKQQLDGSVAPGKKINGVIGYEAPQDWSELEVRFSPNAFSSKAFIFNYGK